MGFLLTVVAVGLLLALHELGHFAAARLFGITAKQISFGFGPAVFASRHRDPEIVLRLVPLGAFVKIRGMNPHDLDADHHDRRSFAAHPAWRRAIVVAAGSATNALVAFAVLIALYFTGTHVPVPMTVGTVEPGSPAAHAQLRPGDRIEAVDQRPVERWSVLVQLVAENPRSRIVLGIDRAGAKSEVTVLPQPDSQGAGRLGITEQYVFRRHSLGAAVGKALGHTWTLAVEGSSAVQRLLRGASSAPVLRQVSQSARQGWDGFIRTLVSLSLLIAAFFLLPIPGLDGGRLVFLFVELARGKPLHARVETALHAIGMITLLVLILAIPLRRIARVISERREALSQVAASPEPSTASLQPDGGEEEQDP